MNKLLSLTLIVASTALLVGCAVSDNERAACEAEQGTVNSERFLYSDEGMFQTKTGPLYLCSRGNTIIDVYNEEVTEIDTGFLGTNSKNVQIFDECSEMLGKTYKTSVKNGRSYFTRYACIRDGAYVQILK